MFPSSSLLAQARAGLIALGDDPPDHDNSQAALQRLEEWLLDASLDRLCPPARPAIETAIRRHAWKALRDAFYRELHFGTAGMRGLVGFDRTTLALFHAHGFAAPFLRGPNLFNDLTVSRALWGTARYGREYPATPRSRIVIGFDTRIRGADFATLAASIFLAHGYTVFLFDEPCPYPEISFAVTHPDLRADFGLYLSASHNDYRYNGFKLLGSDGAQIPPDVRNTIASQYIAPLRFSDIPPLPPPANIPTKFLIALGGRTHPSSPSLPFRFSKRLPLHDAYLRNLLAFQKPAPPPNSARQSLVLGYCAFHGAGRVSVPSLLAAAGYSNLRIVTDGQLQEPDGFFPAFSSEPGREEQPDPGDPRAMARALEGFKRDHPTVAPRLDLLLGTDPDADRCGAVIRLPPSAAESKNPFSFLMANDLWTLLLAFLLEQRKLPDGRVNAAHQLFITISHVTQESLEALALRYGLGVVKTWVGFPALSAGVRAVWNLHRLPPAEREAELARLSRLTGGRLPGDALADPALCETRAIHLHRCFNLVTCEQSNGFAIFGAPPPHPNARGQEGHVPDKDGALAALLSAEAAAWAASHGRTMTEMLDEKVWLDPAIGLYMSGYETDPLIGEYTGAEGDQKKTAILKRALAACYRAGKDRHLRLGARAITGSLLYRTGRYDRLYPPSSSFVFPDEGVRFFLEPDPRNHITVRPSGTGNSLRIYLQLHAPVKRETLETVRHNLRREIPALMADFRRLIGAPRE